MAASETAIVAASETAIVPSESRAPAAAESAEIGASGSSCQETPRQADDAWYEVRAPLHLGLSLRIGSRYTLVELQRRCQGNIAKLKSLEACSRDPTLLQRVAAPSTPEAWELQRKRSSSDGEPNARRRRTSSARLIAGQVVWHTRPDGKVRLARVTSLPEKEASGQFTIMYLDRESPAAAGGADAAGGAGEDDEFHVPSDELRAMAVHEISSAQSMLAPWHRRSVPAAGTSAGGAAAVCPGMPGMLRSSSATSDASDTLPIRENCEFSKASDQATAATSAPASDYDQRSLSPTPASAAPPPVMPSSQVCQPVGLAEKDEPSRAASTSEPSARPPVRPSFQPRQPPPARAEAPCRDASASGELVNLGIGRGDSKLGGVDSAIVASAGVGAISFPSGTGTSPGATAAADGITSSRVLRPVGTLRPSITGAFKVGQVVWHMGKDQIPPWPAKVLEIDVSASGAIYWVEHFGAQGQGKHRVGATSLAPFAAGDGSLSYRLAKAMSEADAEVAKQLRFEKSSSTGAGNASGSEILDALRPPL